MARGTFGLHQVTGTNGALRSLETVAIACALCSRDSICFKIADIHSGIVRICGECIVKRVLAPDDERLAAVATKLPERTGYRIYHWDTFDTPGDDTTFLAAVESLADAEQWVRDRYQGRLRPNGADRVEIVHNGMVVKRFNVG